MHGQPLRSPASGNGCDGRIFVAGMLACQPHLLKKIDLSSICSVIDNNHQYRQIIANGRINVYHAYHHGRAFPFSSCPAEGGREGGRCEDPSRSGKGLTAPCIPAFGENGKALPFVTPIEVAHRSDMPLVSKSAGEPPGQLETETWRARLAEVTVTLTAIPTNDMLSRQSIF
ncbi:MAG: hypothetical protein ABI456_20675 [Ktedonobacteraceae bacterium]